METIEIVFSTIAGMIILEGLLLSIFPGKIKKGIKQIFKNKKKIVKIGLIEMIVGLLILFIITL